jgi:hypothetical protein
MGKVGCYRTLRNETFWKQKEVIMSRRILDISLSLFVLTCAIAIWLGLFTLKKTLDNYVSLIEQTRQAQAEMIQTGKKIQEVIFEAGFATAVIALSEENIIPPTDAEKMISESLDKINAHSERLGTITKYINDYRIQQQRKKRR